MQTERKAELEQDGAKNQNWANGMCAPRNPVAEIKALASKYYGLDGQLTPLAGERDQNFLLDTGGSDRFVLKIGSDSDGIAIADYQTALLSHLEKSAPHLPLPRNVPDRHGALYNLHNFENGQSGAVRLVTYLEGQPVSGLTDRREGWASKVGRFQGALCCTLEGFHHDGATAFMPWNSSSEERYNGDTLTYLKPDFFDLVAPYLERIISNSLPAIQKTRSQVIHNDIHPGNILMDDQGRITGVIDFGDAIRAPVIQDLAVSVASLLEFSPANHRELVADLISAFRSVYPLNADELALLHDAIFLRSILHVALGRLKDGFVPSAERPRPATQASEHALRILLSLHEDGRLTPRSTGWFSHG